MPTDDEWADRVTRFVKAELKRKGVTYEMLVARLAEMGVTETVPSIKGKFTRGSFTAVFMIQVLKAIGCEAVRLEDI